MYDVETNPMLKSRGFTLVEMAIVMTIMAILSTAALPGMLASTRGKYGEKMVADMLAIQDAAEQLFHLR